MLEGLMLVCGDILHSYKQRVSNVNMLYKNDGAIRCQVWIPNPSPNHGHELLSVISESCPYLNLVMSIESSSIDQIKCEPRRYSHSGLIVEQGLYFVRGLQWRSRASVKRRCLKALEKRVLKEALWYTLFEGDYWSPTLANWREDHEYISQGRYLHWLIEGRIKSKAMRSFAPSEQDQTICGEPLFLSMVSNL